MPTLATRDDRRAVSSLLAVAAIAGLVHAAFSLYWAAGGDALLSTLGDRIVREFDAQRWLLVPVGLVKAWFAVWPLWRWQAGRLTRGSRRVAWLGAIVLMIWGGLNTVVGNLVLTGVIDPDGGFDRPGMIGHDWLWDPLFLLWGLALAAGLRAAGRLRRGGTWPSAAHPG